MKKLIALCLALLITQCAFADGTANINIKVSGAVQDNRYFLCIPNVGCLSILAAERGKVYPIYHPVEMHNIYVTNLQNLQVYSTGMPDSCNVTVDTGQTINIYGTIANGSKGSVYINNLHCSVS